MLKNAMTFAGAAFLLVVLAPYYMPLLNRAPEGNASISTQAPRTVNAQPMAQSQPASIPDGFREKSLRADSFGQYSVEALVEGVTVPMVVDTGASYVMISARTAARIGLQPDAGQPRASFRTANGIAHASPVTVKTIDLGSIILTDVQAFIAEDGATEENLLGASFLKRLASVEQRNGLLVLRQ